MERDLADTAACAPAAEGDVAPAVSPEAAYLAAMRAEPAQITALLAKARALRTAGDHAGAVPILRAAVRCRPNGVAILADLGVSYWTLRQLPEAEAALHRALALDPDHAVVLAVLARLARHNQDNEAALALFRRALEQRPADTGLREEIARVLMPLGRAEEAAAVWQGLLEEQPANSRFLAGYGQVRRGQGELEEALALYRRAAAHSPKETGLREEIGRLLMRLNRLEEAGALWQSLLDEAPATPSVLLGSAHVRRALGDHAGAIELTRAALAMEPSARGWFALGGALLHGNDHQAEAEAAFLAAIELEPDFAGALLQLGMLARSRVDDEAALAWFRRAAAAAPDDPSLVFEVAVSLADLRREADSDAMLARIETMPDAPSHERLRLRRLDHCCKAMRFDAALDCLHGFGPIRDLPPGVAALGAGLLAARGDWDEVLTLFEERVVTGTGPDLVPATETVVEAVARAARARGRQADVLHLLDGWQSAAMATAANLREQMAEELALLHLIHPERPAPAALPSAVLRAERGARTAAALAAAGAPVRGTVFLCSDLNYLPGTVVALSSVLRHNRAALRLCRFCVFLSADAMAVAAPMLERLGAAYGVRIEAIPADSLGRAATGFRRDWGSFTPGHRLSDAAYYRILAALWLAAQEGAARALYLDSDTCIGPGLAELLRWDLAGQPLGARLEESASGSIRRAADRLGVPVEAYFNSGVLALDLAHPDCVPALQHAFEVAVTTPERLSFLDQCALNLAFRDRMIALPDRCNSFVRHLGDPALISQDAVVTHYLSRPKPWDPAYATASGARWQAEFYALTDVLEPGDLRALLEMPFRDLSVGGAVP